MLSLGVQDSGEGILPEHIGRIFDPYFTTKPEGKGTGLGLATVYGILKHRGGWVDVESQKGTGTTFRAYFPAVIERLPKSVPAIERKTAKERPVPLTVLLADDDAAILALCGDILRSHGCTVLTAASGSEALQASCDCGGQIDLLVSDVVMPGLSGLLLAEQLRQKRQQLPVLFMTGYSPDGIKTGPGISVIAKPFDEQGLLDAIATQTGWYLLDT
jgi:two-component system, cell cycle sensor histidine kinase and response regulator CckA